MNCSRCGSDGHVEYGSDGQAYCSSCTFYGMNKQCWKCRMYLPWTELQMWNGQLYCQYCLMDIRDEENRIREPKEAKRAEISYVSEAEPIYREERCDRCGRSLTVVYYLRHRKLCENCLDREKKEWEDKGTIPPIIKFRIKAEPKRGIINIITRFLESIIGDIFNRKKETFYIRSKLKARVEDKAKKNEHKIEFEKYFEEKKKDKKI
ncbi:hypothetical protein HYT84_03850 [Candidatus Micrarchaeota archaeon]|nr:hypothetical protein [Candidatus Micrarchaeota archaeon]